VVTYGNWDLVAQGWQETTAGASTFAILALKLSRKLCLYATPRMDPGQFTLIPSLPHFPAFYANF